MKTRDRSRAAPKQTARPSYKNPIDTHNEPIVMTPMLRKRLHKTGEFKRDDGIQLVHYDGPKGETYVAYRWPSGRVQWYRHILMTIGVQRFRAGGGPATVDDDDLPF